MSSLIEHAQRFEVARLNAILNEEPQCEGVWHPEGRGGHDGGPATHVMTLLCCRRSFLFCANRVAAVRANPWSLTCRECAPQPAPVRFVEL